MAKMTDEERALLTDEELEGLDEDENEGNGSDDGGDDQGGDDGDDKGTDAGTDGADDAGGNDGDAGKKPAAAPAGDDAGEGGKGAGDDTAEGRDDGQPPEQPRPAPTPLFNAEVPADLKEQFAALDTRAQELETKFDEGDITAKEYRAGLNDVAKKTRDLEFTVQKAELAAEAQRAQVTDAWFKDVRDFLADHPEIQSNKVLYKSFDDVVLEVTGTKENWDLSNRKQLEKAFDQWSEALGRTKKAAEPKEVTPPPVKKPRNVPPTLAKVPSAEVVTTDDGKYAALDRLQDSNPLKYETELAKMSEAEQNSYLAHFSRSE